MSASQTGGAIAGRCHCGALQLRARLCDKPAQYTPRACDCSYCSRQAACYLSDPQGSLRLDAFADDIGRYRQGSHQAEFLFCRRCGILVAVCHEQAGQLLAAVNARVLDAAFAAPRAVSPQRLAAGAKVRRWRELWFGDVTISSPPGSRG